MLTIEIQVDLPPPELPMRCTLILLSSTDLLVRIVDAVESLLPGNATFFLFKRTQSFTLINNCNSKKIKLNITQKRVLIYFIDNNLTSFTTGIVTLM